MTTAAEPILTDRSRDVLKRAGNPFRNYFARNPDDEVCARYHVPELFAPERDLLHAIIDLYRYDPLTHSRSRAGARQQGRGQDAPAALDQARRRRAVAVARHARRLPEGHRLPRIPAVPDHRHAAGRRQAEGRAAARIRRRPAGPSACWASHCANSARRKRWTCSPRRASAAGRAGSGWAPRRLRNGPSGWRRTSRATRTSPACRHRWPRPSRRPASRRRRRSTCSRYTSRRPKRTTPPGSCAGTSFRASPRLRSRRTKRILPASSPTASRNWSSTSARRGKIWCWRCSRC